MYLALTLQALSIKFEMCYNADPTKGRYLMTKMSLNIIKKMMNFFVLLYLYKTYDAYIFYDVRF